MEKLVRRQWLGKYQCREKVKVLSGNKMVPVMCGEIFRKVLVRGGKRERVVCLGCGATCKGRYATLAPGFKVKD